MKIQRKNMLLVGGIISLILLIFIFVYRLVILREGSTTMVKLPLCTSTPEYAPGPYRISKVIDLDPTFPNDSRAGWLIKHPDDTYEEIYFSTDEQLKKYGKTFKRGDCLVTTFPPACLVGHYPGELPGRTPCIIPTPRK